MSALHYCAFKNDTLPQRSCIYLSRKPVKHLILHRCFMGLINLIVLPPVLWVSKMCFTSCFQSLMSELHCIEWCMCREWCHVFRISFSIPFWSNFPRCVLLPSWCPVCYFLLFVTFHVLLLSLSCKRVEYCRLMLLPFQKACQPYLVVHTWHHT